MPDEFAQALCVIYVSHDDGRTWELVKPADVPEFVKNPDVMANLLLGEMVQEKGAVLNENGVGKWYRAEKLDSSGESVQ